jgi:hypothetical protein
LIHSTVDLHKRERERVTKWDEFSSALRSLDASKFGGAQYCALWRLSAFNQTKDLGRNSNPTRGNGASIGHRLRTNIHHCRAPIGADMTEASLFHGLILAVWRADATRCARQWMKFDLRASIVRSDLLGNNSEIVGSCQDGSLVAPLLTRHVNAYATGRIAKQSTAFVAKRSEPKEGAPPNRTLHALFQQTDLLHASRCASTECAKEREGDLYAYDECTDRIPRQAERPAGPVLTRVSPSEKERFSRLDG